MGGEIGHLVFEAGEKGINKLFQTSEKGLIKADASLGGKIGQQYIGEQVSGYEKLSNNMKQHWGQIFGLKSQIPRTGMGGPMLLRSTADYERLLDHNKAQIVMDAKAAGKLISAGEIHKGAASGYKLSSGKMLDGARNQAFADKDQVLTGILHLVAKEHGEEKAKNLADALGVYFHEQSRNVGEGGLSGTRLVMNLRKDLLTKEQQWRESPFKERSELERKITATASAALAFKAGLAHLSTPLNLMLGHSLTSFGKASQHFFGDGYEGARSQLQFYGAMGELMTMEADQAYKYEHGLIHQFADNSFGRFVHDNFQIPGFNAVRRRTMAVAAMQGKYVAEEHAANLFSRDSKLVNRAMLELKYLGVNGHEIQARGGQIFQTPYGNSLLSKEEVRNAMFENANQRVFIEGGMHRSQFATSSTLGRLVGMYHNYGAQQSNFLLREFQRAFERKDPFQIIKDMTILGAVFPTVGAGIYSLEKLWMGKSPKDIKQDLEKVYDPTDFWSKVEAFSHTAGFGIMTSYARGTSRAKLAQTMLGPIGSAGVELTQDTLKAARAELTPEGRAKEAKKGPYQVKAWEPLGRDILHDIPSLGVGAIMSEHMLPTQKTLSERKPMTSRRIASMRAKERKRLLGR